MNGNGPVGRVEVTATIERKQSDLPRFVAIPARAVAPWNISATQTVDLTIDGMPRGRRSITPWDATKWFITITSQDCRLLAADTGSEVVIVLTLASTDLPPELHALIAGEVRAKAVWDGLTASQQRMLREEIGSAKQSLTRARRARKALLGE